MMSMQIPQVTASFTALRCSSIDARSFRQPPKHTQELTLVVLSMVVALVSSWAD